MVKNILINAVKIASVVLVADISITGTKKIKKITRKNKKDIIVEEETPEKNNTIEEENPEVPKFTVIKE